MSKSVTLWRARPAPDFSIPAAAPYLAEEERHRLNEIETPDYARALAFRRAMLRILLAAHLGVAPGDLSIRTAPDGKPALAEPYAALRFNASTAGEWSVLAAAEAPALGLDAEQRGRRVGWARLAPRLLTPEEREVWNAAIPDDLLALWTAKEAVIKAAGGGLTVERLSRITVGAADASGWRTAQEGRDVWAVRNLDAWPDLTVALALTDPAEARIESAAPILSEWGLSAEDYSVSR